MFSGKTAILQETQALGFFLEIGGWPGSKTGIEQLLQIGLPVDIRCAQRRGDHSIANTTLAQFRLDSQGSIETPRTTVYICLDEPIVALQMLFAQALQLCIDQGTSAEPLDEFGVKFPKGMFAASQQIHRCPPDIDCGYYRYIVDRQIVDG